MPPAKLNRWQCEASKQPGEPDRLRHQHRAGNQRATKSGADGAKARELRAMHFAELIEEYPGETIGR